MIKILLQTCLFIVRWTLLRFFITVIATRMYNVYYIRPVALPGIIDNHVFTYSLKHDN